MRVAISFPGCHRRGGVERVMLECVNFLASRGHETHAFASLWDRKALHPEVLRHEINTEVSVGAWRLQAYLKCSKKLIARMDPPVDITASFGVAAPPNSVVWMQSVHAAWIEICQAKRCLWGRFKQRLNPFHPIILKMEKSLMKQRAYRRILALAPQVMEDLLRIYEVPEEDITILPNGYSRREFNAWRRLENRGRMREQLGYKEADRIVIFVANELERKGFFPLLRAIASLREPDLKLLAVGRLDPAACARELQRLKMTDRVRFVGPTSEVADYYAAADLFALPTQYEAWGLVIVEALASGLPVLTSRLAGAASVVQEGKTGLLLDEPRDEREIAAKLSILLEGEYADETVIASSVESYAWDQILLRYESILEQCVS